MMEMDRQLMFICKGTPKDNLYNGAVFRSGIWKTQADELLVQEQQIEADQVANPAYHGGPDRVVCLYPFEHYAHWEKVFGQPLPISAFGENISASNMTEEQVCIGDIFQIGDAVLQVSQGRYPCATINKRNNNNQLLKKVVETGYTGYFFRVLQPGTIVPSSTITLLSAHPAKVTVASIHHLYFHEKNPPRSTIERMLGVAELAEPWRKKLLDKLQS